MNTFLKLHQPAIVAAWLAIVYNLFSPLPGVWYTILLYAGPILLVAHFIEWLMLKDKLKRLNQSGPGAFIKVMLFGFYWWLPIFREAKAAQQVL
ncbi:hypothetical protein R50073_02120 [Maricurvus nonylphenolicus]|uniref:DUF1145 domain-containing protein n=1 Tax=Maricurvus nonylphenolicus TaxID=1008307 RepID=UPI0036F1D5B6